jgi:hypothetical protein
MWSVFLTGGDVPDSRSTIPSHEAIKKQYLWLNVYPRHVKNVVVTHYRKKRKMLEGGPFAQLPLYIAVANGALDRTFMSEVQFVQFCEAAELEKDYMAGVKIISEIFIRELREHHLKPALAVDDQNQAQIILVPVR